MKPGILAGVLLATVLTGAALAQSGAPIKLADVAELSGGGATVGTNWKNGIDLAIEEINAKGGILGRKLEVTHADSQSNPGVARAQVQKALDSEPYVLLGPGYSGSVKVTAPLAAEAGITQIMGGEAAELTQAGNKFLFRTSFGQQSSMPKVAKYINDDIKAKSVADRLGQQRFRQGRPRRHHQGICALRHQGRRRSVDRGRSGRLRRRRQQDQGRRRPTRSSSTSTRKKARASSRS